MRRIFGGLGLLFTTLGYSHGMDKPGPHGGYIRMPGAYHTEVVPMQEGGWRVYLLSDNLKEPTTRRSVVSGHLETKGGIVPLKCVALTDYFQCTSQISLDVTPAQLRIRSSRDGGAPGLAIYRLPLKWRE